MPFDGSHVERGAVKPASRRLVPGAVAAAIPALAEECRSFTPRRVSHGPPRAARKPVEPIEAPNYDHFDMMPSVGNLYGPNGRAGGDEAFAGMITHSRCVRQ